MAISSASHFPSPDRISRELSSPGGRLSAGASSSGCQMRVERLSRSTLAADETEGIAAGPGIGRVADGAERLAGRKGPAAVIAGHGIAGRVPVVLAAHLTALRASPANRHPLCTLPKIRRILLKAILAHENWRHTTSDAHSTGVLRRATPDQDDSEGGTLLLPQLSFNVTVLLKTCAPARLSGSTQK